MILCAYVFGVLGLCTISVWFECVCKAIRRYPVVFTATFVFAREPAAPTCAFFLLHAIHIQKENTNSQEGI